MLKKLFVVLLLSLGLILSFSSLVSAEQSLEDYQNASRDKIPSLEMTMGAAVRATIGELNTQAGSCFAENCPQGQAGDSSAIQFMSKAIGMTFDQPADTKTYIADLMQDMNIAQPAYAQGLGFASLSPLLELWKVMRNIAYVFFVFVFLIIGFAIMFRQKLGGQAAVTVQQALPRIVVALLMVTFSFAIAGLMIDLMYLVMFMLLAVFSHSSLLGPELANFRGEGSILSQNIFGVYAGIITSNFAGDAGRVIGDLVNGMLSTTGSFGSGLADFAGWIANQLGTLIIFFAIIFAMFRTFFALAKVYFEIILQIAFAPVMLMMGAIQSNVFGNWVKGLAANLAVFPLLLVFIIIGYLLVGGDQSVLTKNMSDGGFVPPFLPGRGATNTVGLVAGIGAIMLLPEVATIAGRFKPKSMFSDLGDLAWKNAMRGKKAALTTVAAPLGAVGAYAGYKYASGRAEKLGLEGNAKRAAILGGVVGGAGVGMNIPKFVKTSVPFIASQYGQTEMKRVATDVKNAAQERQAEASSARNQNVAQGIKDDISQGKTNNPMPQVTPYRPRSSK